MTDIERVKDKKELIVEAYKLHVEGLTHEQIGERIGRHRNTVSEYIKEFVAYQDTGDFEFRRTVAIHRLERVIAHAWELLNEGDIKDSSLTRPQLLHQIVQAQKEINRISGMHVNSIMVKNSPATSLFDMIQGIDFPDPYDNEEIEEAEIVEE